MPSHTSFDMTWRAIEDELETRADSDTLDLHEHALWTEFFRGDRRYEIRVGTAPGVSCLVQVDQTAIDAAVDQELVEPQGDYRGGCWLAVEFCVHGPASEPVDQRLLQRVVEEFWPDVEIHHESLLEAPHDEGVRPVPLEEPIEEIRHHHFRFSWLVGYEFNERAPEFVDALVETMHRLEATAPPGKMV